MALKCINFAVFYCNESTQYKIHICRTEKKGTEEAGILLRSERNPALKRIKEEQQKKVPAEMPFATRHQKAGRLPARLMEKATAATGFLRRPVLRAEKRLCLPIGKAPAAPGLLRGPADRVQKAPTPAGQCGRPGLLAKINPAATGKFRKPARQTAEGLPDGRSSLNGEILRNGKNFLNLPNEKCGANLQDESPRAEKRLRTGCLKKAIPLKSSGAKSLPSKQRAREGREGARCQGIKNGAARLKNPGSRESSGSTGLSQNRASVQGGKLMSTYSEAILP